MGGDPARHEIETGVGVGEFFGGVLPGFDVEAGISGGGGGVFEHGRGDVGQCDLPAVPGEAEAGVAGASSDVEGPVILHGR